MSSMEVCRIRFIFEASLKWCLEVLRFLGFPFVKPWSCSLIIVDKILGCWEKLEEVMPVLHTNIYLLNNQLLSCQKNQNKTVVLPAVGVQSEYKIGMINKTRQSKTNLCKKFCCTPWQVHPPRQPNICIWHNHDSSASSQKTNRISEAKLKQKEPGKKKVSFLLAWQTGALLMRWSRQTQRQMQRERKDVETWLLAVWERKMHPDGHVRQA